MFRIEKCSTLNKYSFSISFPNISFLPNKFQSFLLFLKNELFSLVNSRLDVILCVLLDIYLTCQQSQFLHHVQQIVQVDLIRLNLIWIHERIIGQVRIVDHFFAQNFSSCSLFRLVNCCVNSSTFFCSSLFKLLLLDLDLALDIRIKNKSIPIIYKIESVQKNKKTFINSVLNLKKIRKKYVVSIDTDFLTQYINTFFMLIKVAQGYLDFCGKKQI
ncbi:hypothetical protein BpHYR1_027866 [Brachionus plicatilis]|uniref:Uncharacterized protein n=1 Tax=Brachionus plicatilis TaxID=10195 RepID=A0A3M7SAH8_BRAPC|nr:hypothetical protein BpHYR1_027866 [Brachionus plicatilis]